MKLNLKYTFFIIWFISTALFVINLIDRFPYDWNIAIINFLYVSILILFITSPGFFKRFKTSTEQLIKIKYLKLRELVLLIFFISGLILFIGMNSLTFLVLVTGSLIISIYSSFVLHKKISKLILVFGIIVGLISTLYSYLVSNHIVSLVVHPIASSFYIAGSVLNKKYSFTTIQINTILNNSRRLTKSELKNYGSKYFKYDPVTNYLWKNNDSSLKVIIPTENVTINMFCYASQNNFPVFKDDFKHIVNSLFVNPQINTAAILFWIFHY